MTGRLDEARASYERAHALYEQLGAQLLIGALSAIAGSIELLAGEAAAAERELRLGIDLLAAGPYRDAVAHRRALLALALLAQGKPDDAKDALGTVGAEGLMARVVCSTAASRVLGDVGMAREAVELAAATDALNLRADAHAALADVLGSHAKEERAAERRIALELYERKGNELAVQALLRTAAQV